MNLNYSRDHNGRFAGGDTPNINVLSNPEKVREASEKRSTPFAEFLQQISTDLSWNPNRYITFEDIAVETNRRLGAKWVTREVIHNIIHSSGETPGYERSFFCHQILLGQTNVSSINKLLNDDERFKVQEKRSILMANLLHPHNNDIRHRILDELSRKGYIVGGVIPQDFKLTKKPAEVVDRLLFDIDNEVLSRFKYLDIMLARLYLECDRNTVNITNAFNNIMLCDYLEANIDIKENKCIQFGIKTTTEYLDTLLGFKKKSGT